MTAGLAGVKCSLLMVFPHQRALLALQEMVLFEGSGRWNSSERRPESMRASPIIESKCAESGNGICVKFTSCFYFCNSIYTSEIPYCINPL